jgi:hypothetical protein
MGAEEGGAHGDGVGGAEPARGAQLAKLGPDVEPVARLDLDGGDAFSHQRGEPAAGRGHKRIVARGAGRLHRRDDAAAGARDLFIARAFETHLELVGAIAAEDEVRVAIDQPRRDPAALAIDDLGA